MHLQLRRHSGYQLNSPACGAFRSCATGPSRGCGCRRRGPCGATRTCGARSGTGGQRGARGGLGPGHRRGELGARAGVPRRRRATGQQHGGPGPERRGGAGGGRGAQIARASPERAGGSRRGWGRRAAHVSRSRRRRPGTPPAVEERADDKGIARRIARSAGSFAPSACPCPPPTPEARLPKSRRRSRRQCPHGGADTAARATREPGSFVVGTKAAHAEQASEEQQESIATNLRGEIVAFGKRECGLEIAAGLPTARGSSRPAIYHHAADTSSTHAMSRRGSAKPPLVIDVRSYSDKAKTTYLVETSYEQANTTARGAAGRAAVLGVPGPPRGNHRNTQPRRLPGRPRLVRDRRRQEGARRPAPQYLAVVAEGGRNATRGTPRLPRRRRRAFAAGGGGAAPGAPRVLGRELPPLVWEVVWEEATRRPIARGGDGARRAPRARERREARRRRRGAERGRRAQRRGARTPTAMPSWPPTRPPSAPPRPTPGAGGHGRRQRGDADAARRRRRRRPATASGSASERGRRRRVAARAHHRPPRRRRCAAAQGVRRRLRLGPGRMGRRGERARPPSRASPRTTTRAPRGRPRGESAPTLDASRFGSERRLPPPPPRAPPPPPPRRWRVRRHARDRRAADAAAAVELEKVSPAPRSDR